eukprot:COSAG01_NODE_1275_length_10938_cov_100.784482_3_plen_146_part_00
MLAAATILRNRARVRRLQVLANQGQHLDPATRELIATRSKGEMKEVVRRHLETEVTAEVRHRSQFQDMPAFHARLARDFSSDPALTDGGFSADNTSTCVLFGDLFWHLLYRGLRRCHATTPQTSDDVCAPDDILGLQVRHNDAHS